MKPGQREDRWEVEDGGGGSWLWERRSKRHISVGRKGTVTFISTGEVDEQQLQYIRRSANEAFSTVGKTFGPPGLTSRENDHKTRGMSRSFSPKLIVEGTGDGARGRDPKKRRYRKRGINS